MFRVINQPNIDYKESIRFLNPVNAGMGVASLFWRLSFNGSLSEIQYDINGSLFRFSAANGCTLTEVSGVTQQSPSLAAISDGTLSTTNNQYIGSSSGSATATIKASFSAPVYLNKIWLYPQASGSTVYNLPGTLSVSFSNDDIVYSQNYTINISSNGQYASTTTLSDHGFTSGQLKAFTLPI